MAVSSNWFSSWGPPNNLITDQSFHPPHRVNYTLNHSNGKQRQKLTNFTPFILSLGLMKPPTKPNEQTENDHNFEQTGPFKTYYQWNVLDYEFPSEAERNSAIFHDRFIPENNLPLGVEVYKDRLFISMPKWKSGIPVTLAVLPKYPKEPSPKLVPYPNWEWQSTNYCLGLTSVFRVKADTCGRLWVLDSGQIDLTTVPNQICPVKISVFDLETDKLILQYELPEEFIKQDSLYSNILVDIRDGDCYDAHVYITDVWRYGLVVYSLKRHTSWRITDHLFFPEPLAAAYNVHGLEFEWTDGLFGMTLSPYSKLFKDRILYFHPMSSFREFYVKTSVICNETGWSEVKDAFRLMGQSRGKKGHVSASGMDRNGIMFYNLVTRDTIGCWDSRKPYKRSNLGVVAHDSNSLIFANDLKIDEEPRQSVWIITNRLPIYLYKKLDKHDINFRIMTAYVDEAIKDTICEPSANNYNTYEHFHGEEDCY